MAVKTRLEPLDRDIALILDQELSPGARSRRLAEFAKDQLIVAQDQNRRALGAVPPHETFVDGASGRSIESVKADGVIVFEFRLIQDALGAIGEMLVKASPVRTGRFQSSHILFADGVEVDPGRIPMDASRFSFVNSMPYARKIERGLSPQAPEGVFHVVATLAARRYGNLARIRFGFESLPAGAVGRWALTGTARALAQRVRGGNPAGHTDWLTRQPAVIVTVR